MLTLIRGVPGSGKSTLAKELCLLSYENDDIGAHLEADMYHVNASGKYDWRAENIKASHEWCLTTAKVLMNNRIPVIVSNTFTRLWEMQAYIDHANEIGIPVEVHRCQGNFSNVHNVPDDVVTKMVERMEDYPGEIMVPVFDQVRATRGVM